VTFGSKKEAAWRTKPICMERQVGIAQSEYAWMEKTSEARSFWPNQAQ